jgi:capsular exopolysaccharide synthesis family protein
MSHIFDALQQSAADQADIEVPSSTVATDLLEATERRTSAARVQNVASDEPKLPTELVAAMSRLKVLSEPGLPTTSFEAPLAVDSTDADVFENRPSFKSLRPAIPPQSRLVCVTEKESLAAEKFRFLGVRLRQIQQTRSLKKLLITSTIPQEGKSTVSTNLACALAQKTRQKTLLIDGDLRRPSVGRLFGLGKIPGVSNWLQGDGTLESSIYFLEDAGLWVLPAGDVPRNPLELMQSGRLSTLLDQLMARFDWIVIDTPPVLPFADTSIWMRLADGILIVARQGATEREQLKRGLEVLDTKKLIGAILNSSATTAHDYYYEQYRAPAEKPVEQTEK